RVLRRHAAVLGREIPRSGVGEPAGDAVDRRTWWPSLTNGLGRPPSSVASRILRRRLVRLARGPCPHGFDFLLISRIFSRAARQNLENEARTTPRDESLCILPTSWRLDSVCFFSGVG